MTLFVATSSKHNKHENINLLLSLSLALASCSSDDASPVEDSSLIH